MREGMGGGLGGEERGNWVVRVCVCKIVKEKKKKKLGMARQWWHTCL